MSELEPVKQKPNTVKVIGIIIAAFSCLVIVSNSLGAWAWSISGMEEEILKAVQETPGSESHPVAIFFMHYQELCFTMVVLGLLYLPGGIFVSKFKMWANRLVTFVSALLILIIWIVMIMIAVLVSQNEGMEPFVAGAIMGAMVWSGAIALVIWYLNKRNIRMHFG